MTFLSGGGGGGGGSARAPNQLKNAQFLFSFFVPK